VTRRTPSVVRVFPRRRKDQGEAYFRQQVILYVPWRSLGDFNDRGTWQDLYSRMVGGSVSEALVVPHVGDEYEEAEEDEEAANVEEEWMVAAGMGPNGEAGPEVEIGTREIDRNHSWEEAYEQFSDPSSLPGFVLQEKAKDSAEGKDEVWEDPKVTFSDEQM